MALISISFPTVMIHWFTASNRADVIGMYIDSAYGTEKVGGRCLSREETRRIQGNRIETGADQRRIIEHSPQGMQL